MTPCNVCFLLLSGMLSISEIIAAPTTYDQRQTGEVNVDAKLENFLVIMATSGSTNLFNSLASQLELNKLISQHSKQRKPPETVDYGTMDYETEDAGYETGGREPYRVKFVHIEKEGGGADASKSIESSDVKAIEKIQLDLSPKASIESSSDRTELPYSETSVKKIRSLWEAESAELVDGMGEKKSVDVKGSEDLDGFPVRQEVTKVTRPGVLLKKQLSKKEEESSRPMSEERNELGYKDQLVLIGDGIENCGPGRYRDRTGICRDDESFE